MLCISLCRDNKEIPENLRQILNCTKDSYIYLLHLSNELIGWGQIIIHNNQEQELAHINIIEKYQKQGYGTKLLKFMIYNSPFTRLMLTTITPEFYYKLGFKQLSNYPSFVNHNSTECQQCQPHKCQALYLEKPAFLEKYEYQSEKRKDFFELIKKAKSLICEYSIVNNKIWHFLENPYFLTIDNYHFLVFYPFDNNPYAALLPYKIIPKKVIEIFLKMLKELKINHIKSLTNINLKYFSDYKITPSSDNYDYLYLVSDFATYPGKHFEKKRNRLKKFLRNYPDYILQNYSQEYFQAVMAFVEKVILDIRDIPACSSYDVFIKCLKEPLVKGFIVKINEQIIGILFYSELNSKTVVVHFEFIDPAYDGVGQLLNNHLGKSLLGKYKYINREQDLGIEGLRQSKMSYRPYRLLKKYEAEIL